MSKIEVDAITQQSGTTLTTGGGAGKTVVVDATTVTLGRCGGTVALAAGATQSGFGRNGSVNWQTTVKTGDFTAVSGEGYFVNTTSGEIDVTLPSSPAVGDIVAVSDYAKTFDSNNCIMLRNSSNIEGAASNLTLDAEGLAMTFVYADATKGWKVVAAGREADSSAPSFITASGGNTTTTCGDYKIHTFTGPGTFTVSGLSATASNNVLDYLVAGGGGSGPTTGGGDGISGGGGAGGFRFFANTPTNPQSGNPASPLNNFPSGTTITATAAAFPITVGAGGSISGPVGNPGSVSTFSTVTSAGGGRGGRGDPEAGGGPGASGGGSDNGGHSGGTGNTPPVSPPQGKDGGSSRPATGGGGGGAIAVGEQGPPNTGGNGGAGAGVTGFGTTGESSGGKYYFAGGGGGGNGNANAGNPAGSGGLGGGGDGIVPSAGAGPAGAGTANTGGGGGGASDYNPGGAFGGTGGSGIVIIRYKFQ